MIGRIHWASISHSKYIKYIKYIKYVKSSSNPIEYFPLCEATTRRVIYTAYTLHVQEYSTLLPCMAIAQTSTIINLQTTEGYHCNNHHHHLLYKHDHHNNQHHLNHHQMSCWQMREITCFKKWDLQNHVSVRIRTILHAITKESQESQLAVSSVSPFAYLFKCHTTSCLRKPTLWLQ